MKLSLIFVCAALKALAFESITGSLPKTAPYRELCLKAASDPTYFQNFRSFPEYIDTLELEDGAEFAVHLAANGSEIAIENLQAFQKLDTFGHPKTRYYPGLGIFTGTTLRYIAIADHIHKHFELPEHPKIVEIGAGFGGQCYILSRISPFASYRIYDIPEASALIQKMAEALCLQNVECLPLDAPLPDETIDLVISNYAFSEIDFITQIDYFYRVMAKAKRGYVIFNQIAKKHFGINSLSPDEFMNLLQDAGLHPNMEPELISTHAENVLITWDVSDRPRRPPEP